METQTQPSRDIYEATDRIVWYNHLRLTTAEKYDNDEKGWYFRFDNDNKLHIYLSDYLEWSA